MKICYIDAFSGIAGDMTVGALLDAGASFDGLQEALRSLGTEASFRAEKVKRRGIAATKFYVDAPEGTAHRHLHHIDKMVDESALAGPVKETVKRVFRRLGESEAKVHGTSIEKVHFHEVGAVDSICDIAGAAYCLHDLGVTELYCSPVNVGSGTVNTEHGIMPVPTPATADLLTGKPVYARGPACELTTPTGAAIVAALARNFGPMPPMRILSTGHGAGDKDFGDHANVVRVLIGERSGARESTSVTVLEANIDDATPEVLAYAAEKLMEAGALDVTLTPATMKKGRPATILSVIARPEESDRLSAIVSRETTTLGIRLYSAERRVQARESVEVETPYGRVRVKVSETGGCAPEYEDCRALAAARNVPLREVMAAALAAWVGTRNHE